MWSLPINCKKACPVCTVLTFKTLIKNTLLLPPRILHQGGYTKEEQMEFRSIIFGNILQSALAIIRGMEMLDINFGSPAGQVCKTAPKHKKYNFGMKWKFPLSVFISTFLKMKHNAWMNFSRSTLSRKKGTKVFTLSKGTPCVPSLPLKGAY